MKLSKIAVVLFTLVWVMASCGSKGASAQGQVAEDSVAVSADIAAEGNEQQDMDIIRQFYMKSVFGGDQEFAVANATPKLIDELRSANDFDDGGLALWLMRSEAQDGDDIQIVKSVTPDGDGWYTVEINDMGNELTVHVFMVDNKIADFVK
ncbi:MAG: hypothetical protein NC406_02225 [Bacteroides sp.]|nr:hypothetical protein [Bacteroides sp.]MCM1094854.1 hypothetical protein [Terasakiella sp.]